MRRVTEVIDCWFDSGAMPFAQWGYPHQPARPSSSPTQFPADFISEAIDQTRGWFYSQLAISTLLFGEEASRRRHAGAREHGRTVVAVIPHPFRNCIVLGLMLGEDGQKMSKSKRNYREPSEIFDRYGADALRWYFFANQPPWTSIRYSEQAIKDSIPEFLLRLWNVYSFFVIYANIDGFDPAGGDQRATSGSSTADVLAAAKGYRPDRRARRARPLDPQRAEPHGRGRGRARWTPTTTTAPAGGSPSSSMRCRTGTSAAAATASGAARQAADKLDAYWTLYECLLTTGKLVAPFVPFLAEAMWQNLAVAAVRRPARAARASTCATIPTADAAAIDEDALRADGLVREIVSLGRSARMGAKLKVRQPLAKVEVILADQTHQAWLEEHAALICEELNVKQVEFAERAEQYITYTVLPDLKRLGPRLGKRLPALRKALAEADGGKLLAELEAEGKVTLALPDGPVALDARGHPSPPAGQGRLGRRPGQRTASSCSRPN